MNFPSKLRKGNIFGVLINNNDKNIITHSAHVCGVPTLYHELLWAQRGEAGIQKAWDPWT